MSDFWAVFVIFLWGCFGCFMLSTEFFEERSMKKVRGWNVKRIRETPKRGALTKVPWTSPVWELFVKWAKTLPSNISVETALEKGHLYKGVRGELRISSSRGLVPQRCLGPEGLFVEWKLCLYNSLPEIVPTVKGFRVGETLDVTQLEFMKKVTYSYNNNIYLLKDED